MWNFEGPFKPRSKKQRKKQQLKDNIRKGKSAEEEVRMEYTMRGYEVERTGKGSDYRVRRRNPFTGRVEESKLIEVKSSRTAPVSKLQKKTKKKKSNYKVERREPWF